MCKGQQGCNRLPPEVNCGSAERNCEIPLLEKNKGLQSAIKVTERILTEQNSYTHVHNSLTTYKWALGIAVPFRS